MARTVTTRVTPKAIDAAVNNEANPRCRILRQAIVQRLIRTPGLQQTPTGPHAIRHHDELGLTSSPKNSPFRTTRCSATHCPHLTAPYLASMCSRVALISTRAPFRLRSTCLYSPIINLHPLSLNDSNAVDLLEMVYSIKLAGHFSTMRDHQ